jgi:O-acetyl-ADP-ribose deacetylase (regulator of RNase III)
MIVTSVTGNIIHQADCDAIVNSANSSMRAGSGVCGVIHRAAGKDLELHTKYLAPLISPNAVITQAFNLPNKYILHVCTPKFHIDANSYELLAESLLNVFRLAEENNIQRIALPAIGTGINSFPINDAIKIYSKIALSFKNAISLREIRFVFQSESEAVAMSLRMQIDKQSV